MGDYRLPPDLAREIADLRRRVETAERRAASALPAQYRIDYSGGVTDKNIVIPIDTTAQALKIEMEGYLTSAAAAHWVYIQLYGLSTGNYVNGASRVYTQSGATYEDTLVPPTWGLMIGRLSDWNSNGFFSLEATVGPFDRRGGAPRIPCRATSVFMPYGNPYSLRTDFVGGCNASEVTFPDRPTQMTLGVALDPNGAPQGSFDKTRIRVRPL